MFIFAQCNVTVYILIPLCLPLDGQTGVLPEEIISQLVDEAIEIESQTKKCEEGRYYCKHTMSKLSWFIIIIIIIIIWCLMTHFRIKNELQCVYIQSQI